MDRSHRKVKERIVRLKRQWAAQGLPCHLCGLEIGYDLPASHPGSVEADHVQAIASGGHVLGEMRPSHKRCNRSRQAKDADEFRASMDVRLDDWAPTEIPEVKRPLLW